MNATELTPFESCETLADVLTMSGRVDHICVTRFGGGVMFISDQASVIAFLNDHVELPCVWRKEYALCSVQPHESIVSFVIYPTRKAEAR